MYYVADVFCHSAYSLALSGIVSVIEYKISPQEYTEYYFHDDSLPEEASLTNKAFMNGIINNLTSVIFSTIIMSFFISNTKIATRFLSTGAMFITAVDICLLSWKRYTFTMFSEGHHSFIRKKHSLQTLSWLTKICETFLICLFYKLI